MNPTHESTNKPQRRWLSFGLRGLLVLVLLCSLPLAWLSRDVIRSQRESAVAERIRAAGGQAWYDYQENQVCFMGAAVIPEPRGPKWVRKLFGQHVYSSITHVDLQEVKEVQSILPLLPQLSRLQRLELPKVALSPASVEPLRQLDHLEHGDLYFAQCSSEELRTMAKCNWIGTLTLEGASDVLVAVLPSFDRLPKLVLRNSQITNSGLMHLGQIDSLEELEIDRALDINNEGIKQLTQLKYLVALKLLSTHVTEGCMDSLAKMKTLRTLSIDPGELDLKYYPWGLIRMDNFQSIDGNQLGFDEEDTNWVQCIHVNADSIHFDEYDRLSLRANK